jgi:hypothetical protein
LFPSAETICGKKVRLLHFLQATWLPAARPTHPEASNATDVLQPFGLETETENNIST